MMTSVSENSPVHDTINTSMELPMQDGATTVRDVAATPRDGSDMIRVTSFNIGDASKCLKIDPRNNLPLITVPLEFANTGGINWNDSVTYWFGVVDRCTQWWTKERRVLFVSDEFIYVAHVKGAVTRAVPIRNIKQICLSHDSRWVNVMMNEERDLRFCCMEPCTGHKEGRAVPIFLTVLSVLWRTMHQQPLSVMRLPAETNFRDRLNLSHVPLSFGASANITGPRNRGTLFSFLPAMHKAASVPALSARR